ncbi:MAG: 50S ribosomal protein L10 [Theionarchaea archaeon]|nr:50S ribosomal protein L10 [Theionarchaea archaeon]MBU7000252.1 50S ribosomal protein L10 [Theionarchaea archaeon]MBU7022053.1 50S ribosomal protein L10 [Theionarchaea archaeon]MBU7034735.1 50S ribosomal protein L10 [Theionarchaea archaeon]MBU7041651.1 50S ribosomal protein L10 [Theionarchaea archaeon]
MAHVGAGKKQEVQSLKTALDSYPVVGLVDVQGIKARQLQRIREDLRGSVLIRGSKNTLIAIALKKSKHEVEALTPYLEGGASIICTDMDPFKLNMLLEKSRTPAPARPGDVAPEEIVISAGDTGFPPGPLVGELQRAGIPARIEKGSIIVQNDHVFVKAGEEIDEKKAEILKKLGIEPMSAGLDLLGVCEKGRLYESSVLHVDKEGFTAQLGLAYQQALSLGVEACIVTEQTLSLLVQKAVRQSRSLALNACIMSPEVLPQLLAKAYANARVLNSLAGGEPIHAAVSPGEEAEAEPKKEEEKEKAEEDALGGLGALFG